MASVALGFFLGGCVVAIPVVTGVAEGVEHQKKQNEEANNESRMIKFNALVSCDSNKEFADEVDNGILIVRHDKVVWILPRTADCKPVSPVDDIDPPLHSFAGFYIQYPDEARSPPERGLVTTISDDPPVLNWIYCDTQTYELKYGNRTQSISQKVGEWDWSDDESQLLFDGWEGFVAIDEWDGADEDPTTPWGKEGLRWAVYFDVEDNGLKGRRRGRDMFEITIQRRLQSAEEQLKQMEEAEKKMQVKSRGGLSTQFTAPAKEAEMKKQAQIDKKKKEMEKEFERRKAELDRKHASGR
ncbi:hypothetical protein P280DRAFT_465835 [Massarina eburnea CBS 473.64]|uniref:Uncharacterized protein n=1 Tax=Massarina eburnea CBS 473.64 TaxID=1395130 RepID=A0A6A6SE88_9PLEO|nr:hypothetical protein P280DRAFT_465835 [Massarina eburnea CBS 473.64]